MPREDVGMGCKCVTSFDVASLRIVLPRPLENRLKLIAYCAEALHSMVKKVIGIQDLPPLPINKLMFNYLSQMRYLYQDHQLSVK